MADLSDLDPNLQRLLARRTKAPTPTAEPIPPTPDSLNLSFTTGLEGDEDTKQKIAYLSYEAETMGDRNVELEGENQRLRVLLRTRENDIFKLKNEHDELKTATTGGGLGGEKAIQRIVDLSKKNRELMSQLEGERNNNRKLSSKLNNANNQEVQRKIKMAVKAKKDEDVNGKQDNEKILKERVTSLSTKLTEVSHHVETTKQENKLLLKLLQKEVGEGATVQSILANPNSWRGRSEQISVLQNKLSQLKPEDTTTQTRMEKKRHRDIKTLENNRKQQLQECKKELDAMKEELVTNKKNYDAVKARNGTLSTEIRTLKAQFAALVDKGRNDDNLIAQLYEEKDAAGGSWGMNPQSSEQLERIQELTDKVEMLELNVGQKGRRIAQLEEEITRAREISLNIRPVTNQQPRSAPEGHQSKTGGEPAGFDTVYLLRATEVEKDRLFELTNLLNTRIARLEEEKIAIEAQFRRNSRQVVELEKLVQNLSSKKLPRCDACNQPAVFNSPTGAITQLAILEDEVAVLKSHVEAIAAERQQDLVKYKQLLDQSRQIFVTGFKEMQRQK